LPAAIWRFASITGIRPEAFNQVLAIDFSLASAKDEFLRLIGGIAQGSKSWIG
jgi:hypothetical protein